jgi:hypothetical protein
VLYECPFRFDVTESEYPRWTFEHELG